MILILPNTKSQFLLHGRLRTTFTTAVAAFAALPVVESLTTGRTMGSSRRLVARRRKKQQRRPSSARQAMVDRQLESSTQLMAPSKREVQQRKAQPADASGPWAHPPSDARRIITPLPMLLIQQDPERWSSISTDCKDVPRWRGGGTLEEALPASSILPLSRRRPTVAHRAVFSIAQSIVWLWWDLRKVGILCVV